VLRDNTLLPTGYWYALNPSAEFFADYPHCCLASWCGVPVDEMTDMLKSAEVIGHSRRSTAEHIAARLQLSVSLARTSYKYKDIKWLATHPAGYGDALIFWGPSTPKLAMGDPTSAPAPLRSSVRELVGALERMEPAPAAPAAREPAKKTVRVREKNPMVSPHGFTILYIRL
jgi:hypothetical protein